MTLLSGLAGHILALAPEGSALIGWRFLPAMAITLAFALVAWGIRGVTLAGALAGAVVTFVICISAGPGGFAVVLAVFVLTLFATRFGLHRKQAAGLAERNEGRGPRQIFANLGAATLVAAPAVFYPKVESILLAAMTAALCEAAADTVSSEIGQATGRRAYLITNLSSVPAGTNGGISVSGTIAGCFASLAVAIVAVWMDVLRSDWIWIATVGGIFGMLLDSVMGATLEKPDRLGNDSVNFLGTSSAAALSLLYAVYELSK